MNPGNSARTRAFGALRHADFHISDGEFPSKFGFWFVVQVCLPIFAFHYKTRHIVKLTFSAEKPG
jgi:hypothetical protein